MKHIGSKREPTITAEVNGAALASSVAFSASMVALSGGKVMFPKGLYRYKTHEAANEHQASCLAAGMARLAKERANG